MERWQVVSLKWKSFKMTEYLALHLWVFVVQRKLVKWRMKFYFETTTQQTFVGLSFFPYKILSSCLIFLMFQNHELQRRNPLKVLQRGSSKEKNKQPSKQQIGELSFISLTMGSIWIRKSAFWLVTRIWYLNKWRKGYLKSDFQVCIVH